MAKETGAAAVAFRLGDRPAIKSQPLPYPHPMSEQPTGGQAFLKGGCGCLLVFAVTALIAVLFGGRVHADLGGLVLLFLIGGVVGLVVLAIYNRGRRDGGGGSS